MNTIAFKITQEDRKWVEQACREDSIEALLSETDGLFGGDEWLEVVIPLATVTIPCITKILLKLIDKYGPTTVICGDMKVDHVRQKDVPKVLEKMSGHLIKLSNIRSKRNE